MVAKTNVAFWKNKRQSNKNRDRKVLRALKKRGWKTLVLWECQIEDRHDMEIILNTFLKPRLMAKVKRRNRQNRSENRPGSL